MSVFRFGPDDDAPRTPASTVTEFAIADQIQVAIRPGDDSNQLGIPSTPSTSTDFRRLPEMTILLLSVMGEFDRSYIKRL
jgi:hypothetical protein